MDSNGCDSSNLDGDVRLPPRKRLLAGLKKQTMSESTSQCSQVNYSSPSLSPSIDQIPLSEFDIRVNHLLRSYKNGSSMSLQEIALAAKSAADSAAKAAEMARAVAEEKAATAAKAIAAAKSALNLVAYDEVGGIYKHTKKKNRLNDHVPVQPVNNGYQSFGTCGADEEIARRLHRDMNSSPRITKHFPGSDSKNNKHKKLKKFLPDDRRGASSGTHIKDTDVKFPNGEMECEGSSEKQSYSDKLNEKVMESTKVFKDDEVDVDGGEAESSNPKEKSSEGFNESRTNCRKRGRIKQKKLPLSICSSKDQANPKEELKLTSSLSTNVRKDKSPLLPMEPVPEDVTPLLPAELVSEDVTPLEVASSWKCQDFKASQCIKQDKLVEG